MMNETFASYGPVKLKGREAFIDRSAVRNVTFLHKFVRLVLAKLDLVVTFALLGVGLSSRFILSHAPITDLSLAFLDDSWRSDLILKALEGIWLGKGTIFTYGPIFQWLIALPARTIGVSLGTILKTWSLVPYLGTVIIVYLTSLLLLRSHAVWKRAFYIIAIVGFWSDYELRATLLVLALALFLGCGEWLKRDTVTPIWLGLISSTFGMFCYLISADTGAYSAIAFILVVFAHCLYQRDLEFRKKAARWVLFTALWTIALVFFLNLWTGKLMNFDSWIASLEIIRNYRWSVPGPLSHSLKLRSEVVLAVSAIVVSVGWLYSSNRSPSLARRPVFFLSASLFSLVALQSGIVRSDWGHLLNGLFPLIAFTGAALMGDSNHGSRRGDWPVWIALCLTAWAGAPTRLAPANILWQFNFHPPSIPSCPKNTYDFDEACLDLDDFGRLSSTVAFINSKTKVNDPVLVFPYENIYPDLAHRPVGGKILQDYVVTGGYLNKMQLQNFQVHPASIAIFSTDNLGTVALDGVPNFTRSPQIWLYLQRYYRQEAEISPGVYGLERDNQRAAEWTLKRTPLLDIPLQAAVIPNHDIAITTYTGWPADADFLQLQLSVTYPFIWHLLKPSKTIVRIYYADGTSYDVPVIIEPNKSSSIWIYPWNPQQLSNYFSSRTSDWRSSMPRQPITMLTIRFEKFDKLSVMPQSIQILAVNAVTLDLRNQP